jgi:hypothetical protein
MRGFEVLFFAAVFTISLGLSSVGSTQQDVAGSAISAAQSNLLKCYDAAKAAESAGANISQLTLRLDSAGLLLSRSQLAYSAGDLGLALTLADNSQTVLATFVSDATALESSAAQSGTFYFLLNTVGSIVGTVAVLVGSFVFWRFLKQKYGNSGAQISGSNAV